MKSKLLKFKSYEIDKTQLMNLQGQGGVGDCNSDSSCCNNYCFNMCAPQQGDDLLYPICIDTCLTICNYQDPF